MMMNSKVKKKLILMKGKLWENWGIGFDLNLKMDLLY